MSPAIDDRADEVIMDGLISPVRLRRFVVGRSDVLSHANS